MIPLPSISAISPHKSEKLYFVQTLKNDTESHHPTFLARCAKFISRIFRNISPKKREQSSSISCEEKPIPGACETDHHRTVSPDVFPVQSSDEPQKPTSYTPDPLHELLSQHYGDRIEHLLVVSARRSKAKARNGREFILFDLVDNRDPSQLRRLLMLDQGQHGGDLLGVPTTSQVYFGVSKGGSEKALIQRCGYDDYKTLETMTFNHLVDPFSLCTLMALAGAVSSTGRRYGKISSCWFTTALWSCLKEVQPTAHQVNHHKRAFAFFPSRKPMCSTNPLSHAELSQIILEAKRNELATRTSINHKKQLEIEETKRYNAYLRAELQAMA